MYPSPPLVENRLSRDLTNWKQLIAETMQLERENGDNFVGITPKIAQILIVSYH